LFREEECFILFKLGPKNEQGEYTNVEVHMASGSGVCVQAFSLQTKWIGRDTQIMGSIVSKEFAKSDERYHLPVEVSKPNSEDVLGRVGASNECRKRIADRLLQNALAETTSPDERKKAFDEITLELTNCHLDHHGRGTLYSNSFEMSEPYFAIFTQFSLAVEQIVSELSHEKWQRSVEALIEDLFQLSVNTRNGIAETSKEVAILLELQKRVRKLMMRSMRKMRRGTTAQEASMKTLEEMLAKTQDIANENSETLNRQTNQIQSFSTTLVKVRSEIDHLFEAWDPLLQGLKFAAEHQHDLSSFLLSCIFFFIWFLLLRILRSPRDGLLAFATCMCYEWFTCDIGSRGFFVLLTVLIVLHERVSIGMRDRDVITRDDLLQEIVQMRLRFAQHGIPAPELSPRIKEKLCAIPPPNYSFVFDEEGERELQAN